MMRGTAPNDRGKEIGIPWNNFFICTQESQAIQKMTQSVSAAFLLLELRGGKKRGRKQKEALGLPGI